MKETEDFQKGVQHLVDLTKTDELNPNNLIVTLSLFRKCQTSL